MRSRPAVAIAAAVESLTPGYFALVMATGIVSLALDLAGHRFSSLVLFAIAAISYVVLLVLNGWRLLAYRAAMVADFRNTRRAFGFFTFVAGTNVLGARAAGEGWHSLTAVLLAVALLVWLVFGYVIPWSAVVGRQERPVVAAANGTWFIWVVASQSVAVAAASLQPVYLQWRQGLAIIAVFSWSVGVFLYAASAVFVSLRLMLYPLEPKDIDPPYWVAMGSIAITVVAGAMIVELGSAPMVDATRALIAGLSVVFWCFATWLIPVLIAMGWWRHRVHRVPLVYEPTLWSMIFPLGMYAVASTYLGRADHLPILASIGANWLWVAVLAWALTFISMLRHLWLMVLSPSARVPVA
ncbi:MAG: tellurite resistance/C4-dicarboxylate transporter family protein [Ornithinimicrobium sp.]|uniref:tellurite resistance/C4-dicarboxylate transporter family protein n=1 Tax=Ornithinimicrobium sp. TaxID=1977084 RepID=UPI0026DFB987|nr:tellurite resistance/C4-dicarboxylate transporter family protein [Ornithinimicrobium sp.]MDO5739725.1 tellurite resistance/C4-dicarboxylate transporter family protein [Ornithinimicrobium sp.]